MNGHTQKTDETDQQCDHCGMWFTPQGIYNHERNCPLQGTDLRVLPAGEEASPTSESVGGDSSSESLDDEVAGAELEPGGAEADITEPTRTDGGAGLPLPDSSTNSSRTTTGREDVEAAASVAGEESITGCPDCGSGDYYDADDVLEARGSVDDQERQLFENHKRVCRDCKEVYDP